ncbi:MAG: sigma-70 family RNA polymerase sigma factor [Pirellulales bacterium]|nr:sigma-70 family RNA polymerase sigma factor [Pirellulales bacterium]
MSPNGLEPELIEALLARHGRPLVLYARGWTDSPEDVVQEALVELVRQPTPPTNVVGWLYRAVRNRAISRSRSAGRRRRREAAVAWREEPWFEPSAELALDAGAATAALAGLPPEERETLVARLWGGLSFTQIAELTGTSSSTAARCYQSALAALRERLGVPCPKKKTSRAS